MPAGCVGVVGFACGGGCELGGISESVCCREGSAGELAAGFAAATDVTERVEIIGRASFDTDSCTTGVAVNVEDDGAGWRGAEGPALVVDGVAVEGVALKGGSSGQSVRLAACFCTGFSPRCSIFLHRSSRDLFLAGGDHCKSSSGLSCTSQLGAHGLFMLKHQIHF